MKCKNCKKEIEKYAGLKLCKSCYRKHRIEISPIKICTMCKKQKKILYRKEDICESCRKKQKRNMKKNIHSCVECKRRKVVENNGKCKKCNCGKSVKIYCISCNKYTYYGSKNMCITCYKKSWNKTRKKRVCSKCKKDSIIHCKKNGVELCVNCYIKLNKTYCSKCNNIKITYMIKDNKPICAKCSEKYRLKKCNICGEYKTRADKNRKICYDCYYNEYNKKPEVIARKSQYISKRRGLEIGDFSIDDWLSIMRKFDWKCFYCDSALKKGTRTIDHIIPISTGGKHIKDNIIPCCNSCNSKKHNKNPLEWIKNIELKEDKVNFIKEAIKKMENYKNG